MTDHEKRPALAGPGDYRGEQVRDQAHHYFTASEIESEFFSALRDAGLPPADPGDIVADGDLHRFRVEGDRPGSRNGWAVLHLDGVPAGAFGSWKEGTTGTWRAGGPRQLTADDRRRIDEARARRQSARLREQAQAAKRASCIWRRSRPADRLHPYIERKRIKPHHARQSGDVLVLALFDFDRHLNSLQFIDHEGGKRMLRGGRKRGCFIPVSGKMPADRVLICEGWATGATLAEIEPDSLVLAAVDAGNLEAIAVGARRRMPGASIVICADADPVGESKARSAARAAEALVSIPEFPPGAIGSDFNDLAVLYG